MYSSTFSIDLVGMLVISLMIFPYFFFKIRYLVPFPVKSNLKLVDYYILLTLLTYLVIGGYQQYFWTKNNKIKKEVIMPKTFIDNFCSKDSNWVYIYNFIYYLIFGLIIISLKSYKHFAILILGALGLLSGLSIIWFFFPNIVDYRIKTNNYFLKKTQIIDENKNNAAPSAHVVFAVYAYYILRKVIGEFPALLIPILISISCLKTTQHVFIDIVSGIIYTIIFYNLILKKLNPSVF